MKHYTLDAAPVRPVSHNPELKKKVLFPDGISCLTHISHIVLQPGATASAHSHAETTEIFYCVRGAIVFSVNGESAALLPGHLLVVEPGEEHAIAEVKGESEMIYMMVG